MEGIFLKIYMSENQKHDGELLYEWLLELAKKMGIQGGSAFRAISGFGRHGIMHEEVFFELAGKQPVEVKFALSEIEADQLIAKLNSENLTLFYVKVNAEYGVTGK